MSLGCDVMNCKAGDGGAARRGGLAECAADRSRAVRAGVPDAADAAEGKSAILLRQRMMGKSGK